MAGFANRVLALLSALVLAILTDRVLLVSDDAFPAGLFELPIRWLASECAYFSALPRIPDEWRVVETEQKPFTAELAYLGCANLSAPRVLEYRSIAQYVVPVLLRNPNLRGAALLREPATRPSNRCCCTCCRRRQRARAARDALADTPQHPRPSACSCGCTTRGCAPATAGSPTGRRAARPRAACAWRRRRRGARGERRRRGAGDGRTVARGVPAVTSLALGSAATSENTTDAWLELLGSQSDALVTTGGSSFGYLARALAGAAAASASSPAGTAPTRGRLRCRLTARRSSAASRASCTPGAPTGRSVRAVLPRRAYDERTLAQLLRPMERRSPCFQQIDRIHGRKCQDAPRTAAIFASRSSSPPGLDGSFAARSAHAFASPRCDSARCVSASLISTRFSVRSSLARV